MERDFSPEEIFVAKEAAKNELAAEIIGEYREAKVNRVKSVLEIRAPTLGLAEGMEWGKRILVISHSRKFVEKFRNDDPGAVCPTFHKLTPATHCPFYCQFCFLQGTYRTLRPWVCVYTDLAKMFRGIALATMYRYLLGKDEGDPGLVFNSGEMCDSLATLSIVPGLLRQLVEFFGSLGDDKLLLLTKSAKVDELLGPEHGGNTIVAWSLNCDRVVEEVELGAASLDERLAAAQACQEAEYPIRFRFDPLICVAGWKQEYSDMVERTLQAVQPERITLGSFRLLNSLRSIIQDRFPDSLLLEQPLEKDQGGKRWRYPHRITRQMYESVIEQIRHHNATVPISICKESPRMWSELKQYLTPRACNCLP